MRAAIRIRNGIGEAKNLVVVAVVILKNAVHKHVLIAVIHFDVAFAFDDDGLWMQHLLVLAELLYKLLNPIRIKESFLLFPAFVLQKNFNARIQEREFPQTVRE